MSIEEAVKHEDTETQTGWVFILTAERSHFILINLLQK